MAKGRKKRTQLNYDDTPEEQRDKYIDYLKRNIKKFEFYIQQSEYDWVAEKLKLIRSDTGLKTNSDVFLHLLREYACDTRNRSEKGS